MSESKTPRAQSEEHRKEAHLALQTSRRQGLSDEEAAEFTKQAKANVAKALEIDPTNNLARFVSMSIAMQNVEFSEAKTEGLWIYRSMTKDQLKRAGDAVLLLSLSHASKMLNEKDDAIKFAREAVAMYPTDPHPHMALGNLLEASQDEADMVEAEQECRRALELHRSPTCKHPMNSKSVYYIHCCLGAALIHQRKFKEAEEVLNKAIESEPNASLAIRHLADAYHYQGREDEALQKINQAASLDPDDPEIQQKKKVLEHERAKPGSEVQSVTVAKIDKNSGKKDNTTVNRPMKDKESGKEKDKGKGKDQPLKEDAFSCCCFRSDGPNNHKSKLLESPEVVEVEPRKDEKKTNDDKGKTDGKESKNDSTKDSITKQAEPAPHLD
eukprot:gnl/MRDRNA2_/MRDRNA2_122145_c0_seq1.p1 gnl/MRDRNA2_/MRDRNA2_122145_c0~~gnl/MRDRNA2_/MRDRNA2_122145_c0_seq1.p1  ORF type:complete len:384 (+),score=94.16 gnl/MRDRNA2_/MRDRNA2_122145_c0_seq1:78-1229(+)